MNPQRLTIGLIFIIITGACLIQATASGCAGELKKGSDKVADKVENGGVPYEDRSVVNSSTEPGVPNWKPVSAMVMDEIRGKYTQHGLSIEVLERDNTNGLPTIHCVMSPRNGVSAKKNMLDGLYLLFETFPNLNRYMVDISDDRGHVETDWHDLEAVSYTHLTLPTKRIV